MFVITELSDKVEIMAASSDKRQMVAEQLRRKYTNRLVDGLGLGVSLHEVLRIHEYEIRDEVLVASVTFQVLFNRFYTDEVCVGKILCQNEDRIVIGNSIFRHYEVQASDLFENCEFEGESRKKNWVWNYKGNRLAFSTGDVVRFRTKKMRFEDAVTVACMNEQGLGPCSWWD